MRRVASRAAARVAAAASAAPLVAQPVHSVSAVPAGSRRLYCTEKKAETTTTAPPGPEDDDVVIDPPLEKPVIEVETEHEVGEKEEMGFKAETRQLLDIVACSLYSDKEVFIRELVSNASDALEKRRHLEATNPEEWGTEEGDEEPGVHLSVQQGKSRFVVRDSGVGMTKEELATNLGTIARSGSKAFVRQLQENTAQVAHSADKIIGQFGVGFYSAFMVASKIRVYSRSAKKGSKGYVWESEGHGTFTITECEGVAKGTKIVLDVKDTELAFCTPQVVERVVKKYSNFVTFEITLNDGRLNTVDALWMKPKDDVTNEEHIDFYKFISGAYDSPLARLHYSVDAPISIHALLYIPQSHTEKYGGGRMDSGVNLYSRRVLIQSKAKHVLPEWLRFLKGAVDSEDIPLNISREHTQDGGLMRRLNSVLTKRILKWLGEEAKRDRTKYERFLREFGSFLKEGVCTDTINKMDIAKLLRWETTKADASYPYVSLDEYVDRMQANQTNIYFLTAPSKELAMASPYYEQYKEHGLEVMILTEPVDEFVMQHLETYRKHRLQNIETFDANLDGYVQFKKTQDTKEGDETSDNKDVAISRELNEQQCQQLSDFMAKRLLGKVGLIKSTGRLRESPAVLADHENAQMRKLYKMMGQQQGPAPKYNLHFNPQHDIIRKMYTLTVSADSADQETAGILAEQLFDNALITAGLMEDPRAIVSRLNHIMGRMVKDVADPPRE